MLKKYIRAGIYVAFTFIKFCIIKIFHWKNFRFSVIELFSPLTQIEISTKGSLLIGKIVRMRSGSKLRVRKNGIMSIGNNTSLNHGCIITCYEEISIGEDVQFGPNVIIYDHDHDFRAKGGLKSLEYKTTPVKIGNNVWIGANVVILRGSKIGDNCVVGAGSILTEEYPNNSIIVQKKHTDIIHYEQIN